MKTSVPWYRSLWLPALLAVCIASWFVWTQPGDIRKDAFEYDQIARSLVSGRGYSYQSQTTMNREPGYPVFRAGIYVLGGNETAILWVQILLAGLTVVLIGDAFRKIDVKRGYAAAWGVALSYGYLVYASSHYSEAVTGFLVALVGWSAVRCLTGHKNVSDYAYLVLASAALILTRMNMAFIPPMLFLVIAMADSPTWKRRAQVLFMLGFAWLVLLLPWVVRNGVQFHEWTISGRSGIQFYARMVKARLPMSRLGASFVSVAASHVAAEAMGGHPILVEEQWAATWKRNAELVNNEHLSPAEADRVLRREALEGITSGPRLLVGYLAWTPLEALRLWALPSPGSPAFSIENSFYPTWKQGHFRLINGLILIVEDGIQFLYFVLLGYALFLGARLYKWRWVPGWIILAVTLAHLPFDAIIRYAVPAQPWAFAVLGWGILHLYTRFRSSKLTD